MMGKDDTGKALSFEQAFQKLEKIVVRLEDGEPTLDESVKAFEEGVALIKVCIRKLNESETKMKKLLESEDGSFQLDLME
jgi:exodeoxyribonuclease VII small subunit